MNSITPMIDEIFTLGNESEEISIYRSCESYINNKYYVSLTIGKRYVADQPTITGYVTTDYKQDPPKYIGAISSVKGCSLELEKANKILEFAHEISMNTSGIDNYSLEIVKRDNDYRLKVPEMEMKYYWASRYFEEEE